MGKKRKKLKKVRAAKKKARVVKRLKAKVRARKPVAAKKVSPKARKLSAAKPAQAAKADEKQGKGAKTPIKTTAKQALELLEAKVNEVKGKGKRGRGGRRGKDAWLIPAELPKEDAETRRTRLKNLIKLGKERGFLTYS